MTRDRKPAGMGSLAPNQLLILNGVNTNLISRSLHNVLTNFLILRCVMMEKGPMYGNLKYKQLSQHQIYYGEGRKPEAPLLRCAFR